MQKETNKTEAKIQQEIFCWFNNNYCLAHHNPKHVIFSVPNESANAREAMYKKSIGLKTGVSDMIILRPNEAVFVEVKTETGRQSDDQKKFESDVAALGFRYILVRSLEDFKNKIK